MALMLTFYNWCRIHKTLRVLTRRGQRPSLCFTYPHDLLKSLLFKELRAYGYSGTWRILHRCP